jgi:hypothetical protein
MIASIQISAEQRDALYDRILVHLSGIEAVYLAVEEEDFAKADRLSREFCDELRLVTDDLGWGERHDEEVVELTSPPDVLRRVMNRLRADADGLDEEDEQMRAELQERTDRSRKVREACDRILALLDEGEANS